MSRMTFVMLATVLFTPILLAPAAADLTDGLVAYLPFDGNADDVSGYGNHGTVHGAQLTEDRFGNPDSAYLFDGSAYIDLGNDASISFPDSDFTIALWFKKTTGGGGNRIINNGNWGWSNGYMLKVFGPARFGVAAGYQGGSTGIDTSTDFDDGRWHVVLVVHKRLDHEAIYADGRLQELAVSSWCGTIVDDTLDISSCPDLNASNNPGTVIGKAASTNDEYFHGIVDDVRIYNRALSEEEILELVGLFRDGFESGDLSRWSSAVP